MRRRMTVGAKCYETIEVIGLTTDNRHPVDIVLFMMHFERVPFAAKNASVPVAHSHT